MADNKDNNYTFNLLDPETQAKLKKRAIDADRLASEARKAASEAETKGLSDKAAKLRNRADELNELASKINYSLDDITGMDDIQGNSQTGDKPGNKVTKDGQGKKTANSGANNSENNTEEEPGDTTMQAGGDDGNDNKDSGEEAGGDHGTDKGDDGFPVTSSQSEEESGESEDESEEEEESEEKTNSAKNNDKIKDIFNTSTATPSFSNTDKQQEPRDPTIEEIKQMLGKLAGKAREGAIDGLKDILDSRGTTITEDKKHNTIADYSDDEFDDLINDTIDLINSVSDIDVINDMEDRIAKIKELAQDPIAKKALNAEDSVELRKDYQKAKAREKETSRYGNYATIKDFKIDFYDSIRNQVELVKQEYKTYDEINNEYEGEDIIVKADVIKEVPDEAIPIVDLYFDMSGSWTGDEKAIQIGNEAVATVKEFADRGEIKLNIYYFSDANYDGFATSLPDSRLGSGTHSWKAILQNIKATDAKNVVLMTDLDMEDSAQSGPVCHVDGNVWFIWNLSYYKTGGKEIPKHLIGDAGSYQYSFK